MNLINELNEKRRTLEGLSETYYNYISSAVAEISRKGKLDIDTYYKYAYDDPRLDHISYDEFLELTQLQKRYNEAIVETANGGVAKLARDDKLWKKQMEKLTNRALMRRLAQDMCEDNTKVILGQNYMDLAKLGYDGRQDQGIPEIVRGNFNMFQRNKEKRENIKILNEAIDRSILYLLEVDSCDSEGKQKYAIQQILEDGKSISKVRSDLKLKGRAPFESYKEQFLDEYHEEQFRSAKINLDVYNEKQKIKDKAMDGLMEVDERTYKRLSDLGYSGKDGHPLLQTGYKMYVDGYVLDKELKYCLDVSEDLCYELRSQYICIAEWANVNSSTRKDVDPMTNLILELSWSKAKSKYKKGKISQERYDELAGLMNEMDIAMQDEKIFTAIGNIRKVRAVAEKNAPRSR